MQKKRRAPNRSDEAAHDRNWTDDVFVMRPPAQDDHPVREEYLRKGWIVPQGLQKERRR